jgi:hypothetical protein
MALQSVVATMPMNLVFIALVNDPNVVDPLFLKMEAVCFFEAVTIYITTRHNIPYNMNFHQPCYVNPNVSTFFST